MTGDCRVLPPSVVEADGDIHILQGSVNSSLRSGGNVTVVGCCAAARFCASAAYCHEIGTITGTATSIHYKAIKAL